ncbi:MAG: T9SS type A sorting domain-containing protein [Bacteroidales bacterium]|nr:T9SS type A sorting domain-containing protein [Bacteroidales bacterium]MDY0216028.1 T9SS type A sorting domain-containing protein [Bacteroidales bacterium]
MKKLIFISSFIAFFFSINAQSLVLHQGTQLLTNDQEISFPVDINTEMLGSPTTAIKVENTTNDYVLVKVKKTIIDTVTGSRNSFCWGQCFEPRVYTSPTPLIINENETDEESFFAEYWPNGIAGITSVRYTFFIYDSEIVDPDINYTDSVSVIMHFVVEPASVEQYIKSNSTLSNARPNPASSYTNIPYSLPNSFSGEAQIVVKNILGASVYSESLNSNNGKVSLNTADFEPGIYFYLLVINGQTHSTKKLIVKRN